MKEAPVIPFELGPSWQKQLEHELQEPYIAQLDAFVEKERAAGIPVYPPKELVFNALKRTPYDEVKVLIIGQDPYHGPGQAHGLSFSVAKGVKTPPSLQNIYKELQSDLGLTIPSHGNLTKWSDQGVMLLNNALTVRQGEPLSHQGQGWERFTDAIVERLCQRQDPVIFVLWGSQAKQKLYNIAAFKENPQHKVLTSPHPSPLSAHRGFLGCKHFSQVNALLKGMGKTEIDWQID